MPTEQEHDEYLDALADAHEGRLLDALQRAEERIAAYLNGAPVTDGSLFDLEWAISSRREIQRILEEEYGAAVQSILDDYPSTAIRALDMLNTYGDFTQTSPDIIRQLQRLTFLGFEDISATYLDTIANEIYQNALTGRSKEQMIKSIRQTINGVYMQSDQAEINRLVDIAKNGTPAQSKAAIDKLHTVYAADRAGNNMRRYATQIAQDSLMQFDAAINVNAGIEAGATKWKYYGDIIRDSRQFCRDHVGNTYTTEEIEEIWQGSWSGKSSSDAFTARGGYNCRHHWRPIIDEDDVDQFTQPVVEPEPEEEEVSPDLPPVEAKSKSTKAMTAQAEAASKATSPDRSDAAYLDRDGELPVRFKANTRKRGQLNRDAALASYGKVSIGSLGPEGAAILNQLLKETADLGKRFKTPPIRGINALRGDSAAANMGDGVMGIKAAYFNRYAGQAYTSREKRQVSLAAANAKYDELKQDFQQAYSESLALRSALSEKYGGLGAASRSDEWADYIALRDAAEKKRKAVNKQADIVNALNDQNRERQISTFARGDDLAERPRLAGSYFENPADELRSVVYHEYGHLVHQESWRQFTDKDSTSFERYLASLFYGPGGRRNKDRFFPTKYSETNPEEWFAESFSLYNMGRKDLVDEKLVELLDAIAASNGRLRVFDGWDFDKGRPV